MPTWSDNPAIPSSTRIRAQHVNELRDALNSALQAAGEPSYSFTDGPHVSDANHIRSVHFNQLRDALQELYDAHHFGTVPSWSKGSAPSSNRQISAYDINDLRNWFDLLDPACGSTYNQLMLTTRFFTGGSISSDINQVAVGVGINPATLATISSIETEGLTSAYAAPDYYCNSCASVGVGATQVGQILFNEWNMGQSPSKTYCVDICGSSGSAGLQNNLTICAEYLLAAFSSAITQGYTNEIQIMALAAVSWNGLACNSTAPIDPFYPFAGSSTPHYLPNSNGITPYGSTAGYLYQNSGLVGRGVFDISQLLPP